MLKTILEQYRNGERGLPTYDELAAIAGGDHDGHAQINVATGFHHTAPGSDNLFCVKGSDRVQARALQAAVEAARQQASAQPVAWVRYCSDGTFEGPIMDTDIRMAGARRTSGAWTPLYTRPAEAAAPGLSDEQILDLWCSIPSQGGIDEDIVPFARALLTRASATTASPDARIEELRKGLFEARDAMRVMSNWVKQSDPAGHSWGVHMVDRANAALSGASAATVAEPSEAEIPADVAEALERTDWTPEEALRWYAAGKHFDVVNGRTRILDTGSIASLALKRTSPEYHAMKGADASFPAPAAQQQAEPGADERTAFEAWYSRESYEARMNGAKPPYFWMKSAWMARAAQSRQGASMPTDDNIREIIEAAAAEQAIRKYVECVGMPREQQEALGYIDGHEAALEKLKAAVMRATQSGQWAGVTDEMVQRFLGWRLPEDFYPDCFVSFDGLKAKMNGGWPIGTNLLTAVQTRAMLEYVLGAAPTQQQDASAHD